MKTVMKTTSSLWLLGFTLLSMTACTASEVSVDAPSSEEPAASEGTPPSDRSARLPVMGLANRAAVEIDSLTADQADETVTIAGTVAKRARLLEGWLYQVSDDSGSVWVLNDRSAPEVGETATIEGTVRYEAIVVGEIDAGEVYLQEQSSRSDNRPNDRPADRPADRPTNRPAGE
jgi:hypothetical protein